MDLSERLHNVLSGLPIGVKLIAVSKYNPAKSIEIAYQEGQRTFGESHEQELSAKQKMLPKDIEWHFIGHLQTNKVKNIAPYIHMIESVDSLKLLKEIDKQAVKCGRKINVLLELHVAKEYTKYGLTFDDCRALLSSYEWRNLTNVQICGLMTMASNTDEERIIRTEFQATAAFFNEIKAKYFADDDNFKERSYGMSHDYRIAIECGSTMVRVGSAIFGERTY